MATHPNGELPRTAIKGPHDSQEQPFDEKNVQNDDQESFLTYSRSTFDMDNFLQNDLDINSQWQIMDLHTVNPFQDVVGPGDESWTFDADVGNFSNFWFAESDTTNITFDNYDTFQGSLPHFESDEGLTSLLESPEPIIYPSLELGSFSGQELPFEFRRANTELPCKDERLCSYIPEIATINNEPNDETPESLPLEARIDLPSISDQPKSPPSQGALVPPQNIEDYLINFHSGIKAPKRKRKEFNRREKLKVHLVRQVGACQSCRARKVEVC